MRRIDDHGVELFSKHGPQCRLERGRCFDDIEQHCWRGWRTVAIQRIEHDLQPFGGAVWREALSAAFDYPQRLARGDQCLGVACYLSAEPQLPVDGVAQSGFSKGCRQTVALQPRLVFGDDSSTAIQLNAVIGKLLIE